MEHDTEWILMHMESYYKSIKIIIDWKQCNTYCPNIDYERIQRRTQCPTQTNYFYELAEIQAQLTRIEKKKPEVEVKWLPQQPEQQSLEPKELRKVVAIICFLLSIALFCYYYYS
jgi:hypothetical protein